MGEKLLPCPFCGGKTYVAESHSAEDIDRNYIYHRKGCFLGDPCKDVEQKLEWYHPDRWNTRAPDPLAERLAEAAKEVHDQCCTLPNGKLLNLGPMFEPSETSVLALRAALAAWEGRPK